MSEPTLGEVMRRLDDTARTLRDHAAALAADRAYAAQTYVLQKVYEVSTNALQDDIDDLRKARDAEQNFRRQALLGAAFLAITTVVSIALAIANLLTR